MLERAAALTLLVLALPVIVLLAVFVWLVDGRPAFYRGERLGRGKKTFVMLKLRTLRREAERVTADRLVECGDGLEIPGGRLLRECRLDELPQLWNIVRGDMRFIGPRPERRSVYLQHCRGIPGYARRFAVHPGMVGPAQLFTPHATHKRIRTWIDNAWCRRQRSASELVGLTAHAALAAASKAAVREVEALVDFWRTRILRGRPQQRRLRRVRPQSAIATILGDGTGPVRGAELLDMNEEALRIRSPAQLGVGASIRLRLVICLTDGEWPKLRAASVSAAVVARRGRESAQELVLRYTPSSARSHYLLHQYFLGDSLARPPARRAHRKLRWALPGLSFPRLRHGNAALASETLLRRLGTPPLATVRAEIPRR